MGRALQGQAPASARQTGMTSSWHLWGAELSYMDIVPGETSEEPNFSAEIQRLDLIYRPKGTIPGQG